MIVVKKIFTLLIIGALFAAFRFTVDRKEYYRALSSGDKEEIDNALKILDNQKESSLVLAFKGALTMKSAGFEKGVNNKVKTFKKGAHMLEGEIDKNPSNAEYRFLRLTIQEHAPGILNYNKKIDDDRKIVIAAFPKMDEELKEVILNYAEKSKKLLPEDLKP